MLEFGTISSSIIQPSTKIEDKKSTSVEVKADPGQKQSKVTSPLQSQLMESYKKHLDFWKAVGNFSSWLFGIDKK